MCVFQVESILVHKLSVGAGPAVIQSLTLDAVHGRLENCTLTSFTDASMEGAERQTERPLVLVECRPTGVKGFPGNMRENFGRSLWGRRERERELSSPRLPRAVSAGRPLADWPPTGASKVWVLSPGSWVLAHLHTP